MTEIQPDARLRILAAAAGLIAEAGQAGLVVTIATTPKLPLAMGHYKMAISVRDKRGVPAPAAGVGQDVDTSAGPAVLQAPVLYASPDQVAAHTDPEDGEHGRYLPVRKTNAGMFTLPLYAAPRVAPTPLSPEQIAQEWSAGGSRDGWPAGEAKAFTEGARFAERHHSQAMVVKADSVGSAAETRALVKQMLDALTHARAGLEWYRDMHPEHTDASDDEADEMFDKAEASASAWLADGVPHGQPT